MSLVAQNEESNFQRLALTYSSAWQSMALSADGQHVLSSYGDPDRSWSLLYNLFADKLLQTNVVRDNVYIFRFKVPYNTLPVAQIYQLSRSYYKGLVITSVGENLVLLYK